MASTAAVLCICYLLSLITLIAGCGYDGDLPCTWPCNNQFFNVWCWQCIHDSNAPAGQYSASCGTPDGDYFDISLGYNDPWTTAGGYVAKFQSAYAGNGFSFCVKSDNCCSHAWVQCTIQGPPGQSSAPQLNALVTPSLIAGLITVVFQPVQSLPPAKYATVMVSTDDGKTWTSSSSVDFNYPYRVSVPKQLTPPIQVKVSYSNDYGTGHNSEVATLGTTFATVPGAPVSITVSQLTQISTNLQWIRPQDDGGTPVASYNVNVLSHLNITIFYQVIPYSECRSSNCPSCTTLVQCPLSVSGLLPNSIYFVTISANNQLGAGQPASFTFDTIPTACIPSCNPGTGVCGPPCWGDNQCTCACAPGWGTTPDDTTCSSVEPFLQASLYTVLDGLMTSELNASSGVQILNESLKLATIGQQDTLASTTVSLKEGITCVMTNLNNGFDFLGRSSMFVSYNRWTDFDSLMGLKSQDLLAIQGDVYSLAVASAGASQLAEAAFASANNIGVQIASAQIAVVQSESNTNAMANALVASYVKIQQELTQVQQAMDNYVKQQQTSARALVEKISDEMQKDSISAIFSTLADIISIGVEVFTGIGGGALASLGNTAKFAGDNGMGILNDGMDMFQKLSDEAAGFPDDPVIQQARTQINQIQSAIAGSQQVLGCALELSATMSAVETCAVSSSCAVDLSTSLPRLYSATIDVGQLREVIAIFTKDFGASSQNNGDVLTIDFGDYCNMIVAHIALIKQWTGSLRSQQALLARISSLNAQMVNVKALVAKDAAIVTTVGAALNATLLRMQGVWFDVLENAFLLKRQLQFAVLQQASVDIPVVSAPPSGVGPAADLAQAALLEMEGMVMALNGFRAAAAEQYNAFTSSIASNGAATCWITQKVTDQSVLSHLTANGWTVLNVPLPVNTSFYNIRVVGTGVSAWLINNGASATGSETHLDIVQLGHSRVYDSNLRPWEFTHLPRAYIFQYKNDFTPLTDTDTTLDSSRPGISPYGMWKINLRFPQSVSDVTAIIIKIYVSFQEVNSGAEVSIWGVPGGVSCVSGAPPTISSGGLVVPVITSPQVI